MSTVLITGAAGYLGDLLVRQYVEDTDLKIVALSSRPNHRFQSESRVSWVQGNFATDDLSAMLPRSVNHVIHGAAVTRFDVSQEMAEAINVEGSRRVWEWVAQLPALESAIHVSSLYATGLMTGLIPEETVDEPQFANWYEWSKWQSEVELAKNFHDLPMAIVRLGTMIADDHTGRVVQQNAVHTALKLWFYGLLSIIPGKREALLHLNTGADCARILRELLMSSPSGVYNVAPMEPPIRLGDWVDVCASTFETNDDYRRRRVLTPLFADQATFAHLHEGFHDTGSTVVSSALDVLSPFSPQLYLKKMVANERLTDTLGNEFHLDTTTLVQNTCRELVRTRWGKR